MTPWTVANKKAQNLWVPGAYDLSAWRYLPGTCSGPTVKAIKPANKIGHDDEILLLKKQKPQS